MQFTKVIVFVAMVMAGADACKCAYTNGGAEDVGATQECCAALNGNFVNGNDCAASSISEKLSNFRSCCKSHTGETSDCDYPGRKAIRAKERRDVQVREIQTARAIMTIVA